MLARVRRPVRILVITNLYPPHHAGTYDYRCEAVVGQLRTRGHEVRVLTSHHGLRSEQRGTDVERRLRLNGVFEHPAVTKLLDVKELEFHNHQLVRATISEFRPDLVYVWSLSGIGKSILFTLERTKLPTVFDISDRWLAEELPEDPWLDFWNREQLPFADKAMRASLEVSGQRDRWDELAPTRPFPAIKRLPELFGSSRSPAPNSVKAFRFEHVQFISQSQKDLACRAGFAVADAEVIPPAVSGAFIKSTDRPLSATADRLLVYSPLQPGSGVMTALRAVDEMRQTNPKVTLTVAGQGSSDYVSKLRSFAVQQGLPVEFELLRDTISEQPAIFARHDLLLHVMETDDVFTLAPIQALACGLPLVTTTHGTVGEFLRHGENCIQFAPGDAGDLATRIREMQSRADLREYLARRGRQAAAVTFEEISIMDRVEALLQRAVAK